MNFISTRDVTEKVSFSKAILQGLTSEGGLFVPETFPTITKAEFAEMLDMSYEFCTPSKCCVRTLMSSQCNLRFLQMRSPADSLAACGCGETRTQGPVVAEWHRLVLPAVAVGDGGLGRAGSDGMAPLPNPPPFIFPHTGTRWQPVLMGKPILPSRAPDQLRDSARELGGLTLSPSHSWPGLFILFPCY